VTDFEIVSSPASLQGPDTVLIEIPTGLVGKDDLLLWYRDSLRMPDYFGRNWDALDECLRDLSWISQHKLVLFHRVLPNLKSQQEQMVYLGILKSAVTDWRPNDDHEVVVAFDASCEGELRALGVK
jgi:hypothetical protein